MYFKPLHWKISELHKKMPVIDPKPQYQRGEVWDLDRKQLLVDTVFNGFDIPKIYLRHIGDAYHYEVADGQQRISALTQFRDGGFAAGRINGELSFLSRCRYDELPTRYKTIFDRYVLSISVAYQASNDEIREVFRRLQLGVRLTPPEMRNSLPSAIGDSIRAIAANHQFFRNCAFSSKRFKHDDLAAHAFLMAVSGPSVDVKAPNIKSIYDDYRSATPEGLEKKISRALKYLDSMQAINRKLITRKWGFVDLINWALHGNPKDVDPAVAAKKYFELENLRLENSSRPDTLLLSKNKADRDLYDYVFAFRLEASSKKNVKRRFEIVTARIEGK